MDQISPNNNEAPVVQIKKLQGEFKKSCIVITFAVLQLLVLCITFLPKIVRPVKESDQGFVVLILIFFSVLLAPSLTLIFTKKENTYYTAIFWVIVEYILSTVSLFKILISNIN